MSYLLSNAKVYIKDNLASTLWAAWTFRISVDLERSLDIETATEEAFFVLKNGTQIERFLITATWGIATIVKRWLEQDWITENSSIQKPWWEWTIGYITMKPSDLLGSGQMDDPFIFNWDTTFNNPATFTESIKIPVYANAAARDVAIPTPANGMSVYLTAEWYFSDYQAWVWSSRAAWTATVNADTSTAGKVEVATTPEFRQWTSTWGTWASLIVTPSQILSLISFGDGSDGDITISTPTTLTKDMFYNNLVLNNTITTAGYAIYVRGTLSGTWKIIHNWNAWWNASGSIWWVAATTLPTWTCWTNLWGSAGATGTTGWSVSWTAWTAVSPSYASTSTASASGWAGWGNPTNGWAGWATAIATQWAHYNTRFNLGQLLAELYMPARAIRVITPYGGLPSAGGGWAWAWNGAWTVGWGWGWSGWKS